MIRRFAIAWSVILMGAAIAIACRYTVRDIGFIDLRGPEYSLVISGPQGAPPIRDLQRRLQDSNVAAVVKLDAAAARWQVSLVDTAGRVLELTELAETISGDELQHLVEERIFSESLDQLAAQSTESFAQLVVIEGRDAPANATTWGVVDQAIAALKRIEPLLPRPLSHPVRALRIPFDRREQEQVLLWSLGIETPASAEPVLAVVYGRGQLAGTAMTGDSIELRETLAQLALVGESCECETDRAWLEERSLPLDWGADHRESAAQALGFDPESPLVRAEVVRIVSRGPVSDSERSSTPRDGRDDIEQLLLGYDESSLEPTSPGPSRPREFPGEASVDTVRATVVSGAGWDFDEPPTSTRSTQLDPEPTSTATDRAVASSSLPGDVVDRSPSQWATIVVTLVAIALVTAIALLVIWGGSRA